MKSACPFLQLSPNPTHPIRTFLVSLVKIFVPFVVKSASSADSRQLRSSYLRRLCYLRQSAGRKVPVPFCNCPPTQHSQSALSSCPS
jgi:hypothetical protein